MVNSGGKLYRFYIFVKYFGKKLQVLSIIFEPAVPCWPYLLCSRDALVVATGDMLTSIFSGFVIFVIIGYMAAELGVPVNQVVAQGL